MQIHQCWHQNNPARTAVQIKQQTQSITEGEATHNNPPNTNMMTYLPSYKVHCLPAATKSPIPMAVRTLTWMRMQLLPWKRKRTATHPHNSSSRSPSYMI